MWLLIPLSAGLVLVILAVFAWAVHRGQFDDIEAEGKRILTNDSPALDPDQVRGESLPQESARRFESPK